MIYNNDVFKNSIFFKDINISLSLDSLTGAFNRTVMEEYVEFLIETNTPFSIYIFDIDNFKYINDSFGHAEGDNVLHAFGEKLINLANNDAVLFRYGGDEFAMISLKAITYEQMMNLMRNIHGKFLEENHLSENHKDEMITFTAGGVSFPKDATDYESLFNLMDKALYRGKQKGRNCFIVYVKEKHQNIDNSLRQRIMPMDVILDELYQILIRNKTIDEKIERLQEYLNSVLMIPRIVFFNKQQFKNLFERNHAFYDNEFNAVKASINHNGSFVVNDLKDIRDKYPVLKDNCKDKSIYSFVVCKVYDSSHDIGYLFLADNQRRHVWQANDRIIITFVSKILALILYMEQRNS